MTLAKQKVQITWPGMHRGLYILLLAPCLLFSCLHPDSKNYHRQRAVYSSPFSTDNSAETGSLPELSPEQQAAFDALNQLQGLSEGHLYSAFCGSNHCYHAWDTSFVISKDELLIVLGQLLNHYSSGVSNEERGELIAAAVLAQDEYIVEPCKGNASGKIIGTYKGFPSSGAWILRNVLGRRDIILEW